MQLIVHGRNIEINEWIEEYVEKKVSKLERFVNGGLEEVRAELTQSNTRTDDDRYTFQVTMRANKQLLRAEESTSDIFASIDAAVDKLSRQVKRSVERRRSKRRQSVATNTEAVMAATAILDEVADEEGAGRIIRRKQFILEPMDEEEALDQLELLGHDFFLFFNPDANAVNLIYRRKDGNYGLLQPEIA